MSTVATLNVSVTANTANFHKHMKDAEGSITAFTVAAGELIAKGVEMGAEFAAHAVEGVVDFVKESMNAIDTAAVFSDKLGMSTTALMVFHEAANDARLSTEQMDMGLQHMMQSIGEADFSPAKMKLFESMNLSVADLKNMHADQAFKRIADSISSIHNPMQQAYMAQQIFGRGGKDLVTILRGGSAGLEETAERALHLGTALSEIDVQQVVRAKSGFLELKDSIEGAANKLAVALAPFLTEVTHRVLAFADAHGGLAKVATEAFEWILKGLARVADYVELLKAAWYGMKAVVVSVVDFIVMNPIRALAYAIDAIVVNFELMANDVIKAINKIGQYTHTFGAIKLFDVNDTGLSNWADKAHKTLIEQVGSDVDNMKKSFNNFADRSASSSVEKWVSDVRAGANKAAQAMVDAKKERENFIPEITKPAEEAEKIESKAKESRSTLAVSHAFNVGSAYVEGLKNRSANDPAQKMVLEQKTTNNLLNKLLSKTANAVMVAG